VPENAERFFVSRLTHNTDYEDATNLGDRQLYVEYNPGKFVFSTYNSKPANPSVSQDIKVATPFEGRWQFIYFSYSADKKRAVGFYYAVVDENVRRVQFNVLHIALDYFRYSFGGQEFGTPGFNGQFANIVFGIGKCKFVDTVQDLIGVLKQNQAPRSIVHPMRVIEASPQLTDYKVGAGEPTPVAFTTPLAEQYAVAGWFRWTHFTGKHHSYHMLFRLTEHQTHDEENSILGDYALAMFLGD
jgi:hypothetical protein